MHFFHLSDLHIGLKLIERDLREDQEYIFEQIIRLAKEQQPDAMVIAGDIYDKAVPSAEAVEIFDSFMKNLSEEMPQMPVMIISGNHDSAARLNCFRSILSRQNVYMIGTPPTTEEEHIEKVTLQDAYGDLHFYLLPFVKPSMVREIVGTREDGTQHSYDEALHLLIERENIDTKERNVLVSHQFYLPFDRQAEDVERMDSEIRTVGNIDEISADVLEVFDYAALGHIHKPQAMGREMVRYAGSILKYSFSEIRKDKQATILTISKNKQISLSHHLLKPLRDMREMECSLESLLKRKCEIGNEEDYMHVILTDEEQILDAIGKVRTVYPNVMQISFKNRRHMMQYETIQMKENQIADQNPMELFEQFYKMQNHIDLDEKRAQMAISIFEEVIR